VLARESEMPRDGRGRVIAGGTLGVPRKAHSDQLMNDPRPLHACKGRLRWVSLPHGCQLCQLVVGPDEIVEAGGRDLKNLLYESKHHPDWLRRSGFGRPHCGEEYVPCGARPGQKCCP
jgi:hypothetical protein